VLGLGKHFGRTKQQRFKLTENLVLGLIDYKAGAVLWGTSPKPSEEVFPSLLGQFSVMALTVSGNRFANGQVVLRII
jgi:hypothetical protein